MTYIALALIPRIRGTTATKLEGEVLVETLRYVSSDLSVWWFRTIDDWSCNSRLSILGDGWFWMRVYELSKLAKNSDFWCVTSLKLPIRWLCCQNSKHEMRTRILRGFSILINLKMMRFGLKIDNCGKFLDCNGKNIRLFRTIEDRQAR